MESLTLKCFICFGINNITLPKNDIVATTTTTTTDDDDDDDRFFMLPLYKLNVCGHSFCASCVYKIQGKRIIKCPTCRAVSNRIRVYSVSKTMINYVDFPVANVKRWELIDFSVNLINDNTTTTTTTTMCLYTFIRTMFENNVSDEEAENMGIVGKIDKLKNECVHLQDKRSSLSKLYEVEENELLSRLSTIQNNIDNLALAYQHKHEELQRLEEKLETTQSIYETLIAENQKRHSEIRNFKSIQDDYAETLRKININNVTLELQIQHKNELDAAIEKKQETMKTLHNQELIMINKLKRKQQMMMMNEFDNNKKPK